MRKFAAIVGAACLIGMVAAATADSSLTPAAGVAKADPAYSIGEMRIQTLPAFTYLYNSDKTNNVDIPKTVEKLMAPLNELQQGGKVHFNGPPVFIYHDIQKVMDPKEQFTLDVGFPVEEATQPGNLKVRKFGGVSCATILYSGPLGNLPAAYDKLMAAMKAKNIAPKNDARETYLMFEEPESPNNVVLIQMEIDSADGGKKWP